MVAAAADAVVQVEQQAVGDGVALVVRPAIVVFGALELLRILELLERDEREHVHNHDREHERERKHFAVFGDGVDDVLQVFVARHNVLNVEDELQLRHEGAHEGHDDVREPLDEHLVADQSVEVVHGFHGRDGRHEVVPLGLVVAFNELDGIWPLELQDGPQFVHVCAQIVYLLVLKVLHALFVYVFRFEYLFTLVFVRLHQHLPLFVFQQFLVGHLPHDENNDPE